MAIGAIEGIQMTSKYQNGDCIGFFEGYFYIYGIDQPFLKIADGLEITGLEETTPEHFLEQYEIEESDWFRWGLPSNNLKSMGCNRGMWPAAKGSKGAFPVTIWEAK